MGWRLLLYWPGDMLLSLMPPLNLLHPFLRSLLFVTMLQGAPHLPMSGPGAVGWRVHLHWPGDMLLHLFSY
jgi:hypothetical protein